MEDVPAIPLPPPAPAIPKNSGVKWTPEDYRRLDELLRDGRSGEEIRVAMGRTLGAIEIKTKEHIFKLNSKDNMIPLDIAAIVHRNINYVNVAIADGIKYREQKETKKKVRKERAAPAIDDDLKTSIRELTMAIRELTARIAVIEQAVN